MSTNINISVGDNKLLAQARLQQNASRQAQLEKEANKRLQSEAEINRVNALAAQGKDANGNPITGSQVTQPQIERRPAANRFGGPPNFLLVPHQDFILNSISTNTIAAKTKGIKNNLFFEVEAGGVFVPSGGPGGASFLQAPQATVSDTFYSAYIEFPLCDNTNVLDVADSVAGRVKVLTSDGVVDATQLKKPVHKLKEYTVEAYFKGDTSFPPIGTVLGRAEIEMSYADYVIYATLLYNAFHDVGPTSYLYSLYVQGYDGFEVEIFFGSYWLADPSGPNASMPSYGYIWPELLQPDAWYHLALVKTETSQSIYFQGTLIASVLTDFSPLANLPDDAIYTASAFLESGGNGILQLGLSGFRFTPKVLYTGPFTPPASITSLA